MKRNKYIMGALLAGGLLAASCTDFADYNDVASAGTAESNKTLWENIESNSQLTQFAELVKKAGLDKELSSSHYYTVWAPLDGTFDDDYQTYLAADSATVRYKFVQSHVANFSHTASGKISERVMALNAKSFNFSGSGSYIYDNSELSVSNVPSVNGLLHTIKGSAVFLPNIYEYIFEVEGSDSIKNYFKHHEDSVFNIRKSTEGEIIDGRQTYLDSIWDITNRMTNRLGAYIQREDSNYTMLMPTDKAYEDAYNRIKKNFNYSKTIAYPEKFEVVNNTLNIPTSKYTFTDGNETYLSDSLTRFVIARSLFFNNNWKYNRWTTGYQDPKFPRDTIMLTRYTIFSNGQDVLKHVVDSVKASNGRIWTMDSLPHRSWDHWCDEIIVNPLISSNRAYVMSTQPVSVTVSDIDIDTTKIGRNPKTGLYPGISYLDCMVTGDRTAPQLYFYIKGALSTAYNVYVVTVPANIKKESTEVAKQYKLGATIYYSDANGNIVEKEFGRDFLSDSTRVDTLLLGQVEFPVSYASIPAPSTGSTNVYPYLQVRSRRSTLSQADWPTQDNRLRIASIILRPVEYDAYLDEQKALYNKPEDE